MASPDPHHTSYEKIVERPEQWGLDAAGYRALKKSPWVVTEKMHGANFALIAEGTQVRCAKRKALLELASAVSKLGPPPGEQSPQAEQLVALLVEDIQAQLQEDVGDSLRALAPEQRAALEAHVTSRCAADGGVASCLQANQAERLARPKGRGHVRSRRCEGHTRRAGPYCRALRAPREPGVREAPGGARLRPGVHAGP